MGKDLGPAPEKPVLAPPMVAAAWEKPMLPKPATGLEKERPGGAAEMGLAVDERS